MPNLNKSTIPIAVDQHTKLNLSCDHATTGSFMRLQPVYYRHMLANEDLSVHVNSTVRPAPVEVPFFGTCTQNLRAFFVPYRLVFPNWENFILDNIATDQSQSSLVASPPVLDSAAIFDMFEDASYQLSDIVTTSNYDFTYGNSNYKLRRKGRRFLSILRSLGYELIAPSGTKDPFFNAIPILSLAKIYVDWYANQNYLNKWNVLQVQQFLNHRDPVVNLVLKAADLFVILDLIYRVVYDTDDYFVNAWDNPTSPVNGQFSNFTFIDPTSSGGAFVQTNANGTPEMVSNPNYPDSIGTTYIHEALKRLTDYQRRHSLAGSLAINRALATYGMVTDNLKLQRSIYVGYKKIAIQSGSVMATADSSNGSTNSTTGSYAGAAFAHDSGVWSFRSDEEGMFIICSTIVPQGNLVQGYDRNNRLLQKQDFFNPDYDSLGCQAIEKGEVYVSQDLNFLANDYFNEFGFSGRYAEKKRPKSLLTGDFRHLNSVFQGGDAWHLFRLLSDGNFIDPNSNIFDPQMIQHSEDFTMSDDSLQYYRIFQFTDDYLDPFYLFMHFDVAAYAPCKPLFETYEFSSQGKKVTVNNGAKVN